MDLRDLRKAFDAFQWDFCSSGQLHWDKMGALLESVNI